MQSAPASFRRRTLQTSRRSGRRPGVLGVVARLLVSEQEALAVAVLGGGKAVLGIEEDGGGMPSQNFGDVDLELLEIVGVGGGTALLGEGFLKGSALIHSCGGDDTALIGDGLEAGKFAWGQLHFGLHLLSSSYDFERLSQPQFYTGTCSSTVRRETEVKEPVCTLDAISGGGLLGVVVL